jgi:hypothetical protein
VHPAVLGLLLLTALSFAGATGSVLGRRALAAVVAATMYVPAARGVPFSAVLGFSSGAAVMACLGCLLEAPFTIAASLC